MDIDRWIQIDEQINGQIDEYRQINRQMDTLIYRYMDRQMNTLIDRYMDKQMDRQSPTGRQIKIQLDWIVDTLGRQIWNI